MPLAELPVVAEGETTRGERWYLRAGGSPETYDSMLETVHADGRRDQGCMSGPALYPGELLNVYLGRADQGPLRVVVRSDVTSIQGMDADGLVLTVRTPRNPPRPT